MKQPVSLALASGSSAMPCREDTHEIHGAQDNDQLVDLLAVQGNSQRLVETS